MHHVRVQKCRRDKTIILFVARDCTYIKRVYDEGIKAYGSQNEWENAIKDFDKSVNDPKLQQVSNDTINICIAKFTSNQATASASSASPAK